MNNTPAWIRLEVKSLTFKRFSEKIRNIYYMKRGRRFHKRDKGYFHKNSGRGLSRIGAEDRAIIHALQITLEAALRKEKIISHASA
jgi:hypothetical protein